MDIYIDNILNDEKLQLLFQQMNIGQEKQRELGLVFYQNFIQSPTTDYYLKKIKDALLKISSLSLIQDDLQDIIKDIANSIHQHSIIFQKTIQHVENIELKSKQMQEKMDEMQEKMNKMQEKSNMKDALIISYEISSLYIEYFVKPVFLRLLGTSSWDQFTNKLTQIEVELDDNRLQSIEHGQSVDDEQLYTPLTKFLEPLQKEISISLTDIRFLRKDRTGIAHYRHRTPKEQLLLIEQAKKFYFPEQFEHKQLVNDMICALEKSKSRFHRCR
ncbi:unnamed protein product [Rotaria magnacalcarata]|nr:unnamed protein product [Rotaria magnacalcarata]CAF1970953.1 unnamed protein product [Rotaria magnacalcarata]CAF3813083.1 unnamed protein product [Rotaria magnacalcarata]CAF3918037.1 unnamed protein product [Rotaria magnacalcarata]CAF4666211.1 unnamed protein product [Rotaria magnacalcarata]